MVARYHSADEMAAARAFGAASGDLDAKGGELVIRALRIEDLGDVVHIERAAFSDPWSHNSFASLLAGPHARAAAAVMRTRRVDGGTTPTAGSNAASGPASDPADRLVGYVIAIVAGDDGEIVNIAVSPEARRSGVGAALLDHALREVEAEGVGRLYLEVRESNAAARALYTSRNFREIGRRRRYYRQPSEDAIVLCRLRENA
jgi:[ribosomal protein S18]-alanine N-acetyltransferase